MTIKGASAKELGQTCHVWRSDAWNGGIDRLEDPHDVGEAGQRGVVVDPDLEKISQAVVSLIGTQLSYGPENEFSELFHFLFQAVSKLK